MLSRFCRNIIGRLNVNEKSKMRLNIALILVGTVGCCSVVTNGFILPQRQRQVSSFSDVGRTSKQRLSFSLEEWVVSENGHASIEFVKSMYEQSMALLENVKLESISSSISSGGILIENLSVSGWVVPPLVLGLLGWKGSYPSTNYRDGYEPYSRGMYDAIAAKLYYSQHPFLVAQRMLELLRLYNGFLLGVAYDKYILRNEPLNRNIRAQELLRVMQQAGPTSIKVGQALSVRPDLIAAEYATALGSLQDNVPPFDSNLAMDILNTEWGAGGNNGIELLSKQPVASASIGQVYKGKLGEKEVAVKVQRPNVLAEIALDLYIVKEIFAPIYKILTKSPTDFASLANEWGRGFIGELDYTTEAKNTIRFNEEMKKRQLDAVVMAPSVEQDYSTKCVLVTQWIDGVRLDRSTAGDVSRLCGVALNAYLVMLLETGLLHCDPHPGNLLRQNSDGKLIILDFGMTLETDPTLQYSLLEFVAHLTAGDYDKVPQDFIEMGFLKKERLDTVMASGFLQPLTLLFQQAKQGGGGTKVRERIFAEYRQKYPGLSDDELRVAMRDDMQQQMKEAREQQSAVTGITMEVEELQRRNADAFTIPEWFLYTSRAFLTLEGISLSADEDYSIIQSCFPYVAKRLLQDDSPRAQQALKELLYGSTAASNSNLEKEESQERWLDLAQGFSTYTSTTKDGNSNSMLTLAKESADIVLADNSMVQRLLLEESTLATSAQVKDALSRLPGATFIDAFLQKSPSEEKAQQLLNKLLAASAQNGASTTSTTTPQQLVSSLEAEQVAMIVKELREGIPKYGPKLGQLGNQFAIRLLEQASTNIETTLEKQNEAQDNPLVRTAAMGLVNVANTGANVIRSTTTSTKQK